MENLFGDLYTHELCEIYVDEITLEEVKYTAIVPLQKMTSKATWRPAPGRKMAYLLKHKQRIIGYLFFASPVINLAVRDNYLDIKNKEIPKGILLRNYMDLSGCVGIQPISWYWNIGKLLAMVATCKEISDRYKEKYGDELKGITTTSVFGKSIQYNRVYKHLGYTMGYGHEHISEDEYQYMLKYMANNNIPIPSCKFGEGSNPRMRRIAAYKKAVGEKVNFIHGHKRGFYYHDCENKPLNEIIIEWYNRWGKQRYENKKNELPPYNSGLE